MIKKLLMLVAMATLLGLPSVMAQASIVSYNPASGSVLTELASFDVTFNCDMALDSSQGGYVFLDGIMVQTKITTTISDDKRTVTFAIEPTLVADGEYTFKYFDWLVRPANSADGYTPSISPVYTIDASNGIGAVQAAEAGDGKVYNLQGVEVNGTPSRGIYIINNKKVAF